MAEREELATIKKYANRRLYDSGRSAYVTFDDLATMIREGMDVVVRDANGADITRSVLTQVILDQESRGQGLLPTNFLKQLIRLQGNGVDELAATYLDFCLDAFRRDQDLFRRRFAADPGDPLKAVESHVGRSVEMFVAAAEAAKPGSGASAEPPSSPAGAEIESVRRKIDALRTELDRLSARADLLPDPEPSETHDPASRGN